MAVQFFSPEGKQIVFQVIDRKKYRGVLLPGSAIQQHQSWTAAITVQEWQHRLVDIGHWFLEIFSKIKLSIHTTSKLRLEALLSGEMHIFVNGKKRKFRAGEYRITDASLITVLFKKNTSCSIFVSQYSKDLLQQIGVELFPCAPRRMPAMMMNLIDEILHNPYSEDLRDFYYENCVRELLFFHLTQNNSVLPGTTLDKDIAAIYKADAIIASNFQQHYTIEELSRMTFTNPLKLKTGFKRVYNMGVFERLVFYRMEQAKKLLSATNKSIGEIAGLTGYDTVAGFIHAFRREVGLTPREWRKQEQQEDNEEEDIG